MKRDRLEWISDFIKACLVIAWMSLSFAIGLYYGTKEGTINGEVTGKQEANNRFYIDLRIEIPANDYIGLDVGDEYEIGRK